MTSPARRRRPLLRERDYEVGYGKPPVYTRFQKGWSGNPCGRPRGSKNNATLLKEALDQRVTINENGQRRQISKREAMFTQLANKAAQGDPRAIQTVLRESEKLDRHNEKVSEEAPARPIGAVVILPDNGRGPLDREEEAVMVNCKRRSENPSLTRPVSPVAPE
jgi:hypothetical protein